MAKTSVCKLCDASIPTPKRLAHLRAQHGSPTSNWPQQTIDEMFWRGVAPVGLEAKEVKRLLSAVVTQHPTSVSLRKLLRVLTETMDASDVLVLQLQPKPLKGKRS